MGNSVNLNIIENKITVVAKEDKKVTVAAPYVKNENNYTARLVILGYYDTLSDLTTAVTSPSEGDPYGVGTEAPYTIYIWTGTEWKDNGTLKGEKGDPTEWIRGTVDPTTEGIDGDLYLNYTTWHVWEKISGTWEDKGTIKGADGGSVPAISTGDAGKFLKVNATETDAEWTALNLDSAPKLTTARTISLGGDVSGSASFDGSQDITITATVADASTTVKGVVELATPEEVKQGTDNERAVTPAGFKAALVSPAMTGSATLNGTTDNTVQLTDIVTTLGLEVGDVIRIQYSGYDKLHSVESITNNDLIVVNYEHAGNRGNGSLKLEDKTAAVTITRIAKWFNAPLGLGQAWQGVTSSRAVGTTYTNTTGRTIVVTINTATDNGLHAKVDEFPVYASYLGGSSLPRNSVTMLVPPGSTYRLVSGGTSWIWGELR